jgi:glutamate N-acetyltransferase/amino-acid N-acetyltransferase
MLERQHDTDPRGFAYGATAGGLRFAGRDDLAVILSDRPAAAAGVFTRNLFPAAPVLVARQLLQDGGDCRAIAVNAGQANACTGEPGIEDCRESLRLIAERFGLSPREVLPASTGVIGERLDMDAFRYAVPGLSVERGDAGPLKVARAMTTTDTFPKLVRRSLRLAGGEARLLGMAKGAGMICPDMATMLGFIVCDARVERGAWQEMIASATEESFNRITVDGDTSTNDCMLGLANGASGARAVGEDARRLRSALVEVCRELAYLIVQDAEGGTKVATIRVTGARDDGEAERAARTVAHSPLVKTALFGEDPNWGRIVAALGRSGAGFEPDRVRVAIAGVCLFVGGQPAQGDAEALLEPYIRRKDVPIDIDLGEGEGEYSVLTSDLSLDYVRINAEYRS